MTEGPMDANLPEQFMREDVRTALGEPLTAVLDMSTWSDGGDLAALYESLRRVVAESVREEDGCLAAIRRNVFTRLGSGKDRLAPEAQGLYRLVPEEIEEIHRGILFNGGTECCDGTVAVHDSLVLSVTQIGISLVAYQGAQGTWAQRLYRRDLHTQYSDPVELALALLERRASPGVDPITGQSLSRVLARALMEYAERAALLHLSRSRWRMGHGSPLPSSMLAFTRPDLLQAGLAVLRELLLEYRRFVYVVSEPADRLLLTLGNALRPLEFAVVNTIGTQYVDGWLTRLMDDRKRPREEVRLLSGFLEEVRAELVVGVYRAGEHVPARVFYAHREFVCDAAALAIADSVLQPHRGFPMLIDLADLVCRNTFDGGSFGASIQDAYAAAGEPLRYMGERETRSR
jgi:hypothetical protein